MCESIYAPTTKKNTKKQQFLHKNEQIGMAPILNLIEYVYSSVLCCSGADWCSPVAPGLLFSSQTLSLLILYYYYKSCNMQCNCLIRQGVNN